MKHVKSDEFEAHPKAYLSSTEPLTIEQNGHAIGYYIPSRAGRQESLRQTLDEIGKTVQGILDRTGWTEDEFADLFDLNKSFEEFEEQLERLERRRTTVATGTDAAHD